MRDQATRFLHIGISGIHRQKIFSYHYLTRACNQHLRRWISMDRS
jgi:hypothetical protein